MEREAQGDYFIFPPDTEEDTGDPSGEGDEEDLLTDAEVARLAFSDDFNENVGLLIAMADAVNALTTRLIDGWRTLNARFIEELHGEGTDYDPYIAEQVNVTQIGDTLYEVYETLSDESVVDYDAFIEGLEDTV